MAGSDTAVVDADGPHSWAEIVEQSERFARTLSGSGRIALILPQRAEAVALLAACERVCPETVVISSVYGRDRARTHAASVGATALVSVENGSVLVEVLGERVPSRGSFVLVLTSGTEGPPKCARHTWDTLAVSVQRRSRHAGTRFFCGHPLGQFGGLQVIAQAVFGDGTLHVPCNFAPYSALTLLAGHGADCLCGTPSYVRQILIAGGGSDLRKAGVRRVTLGGEIADQLLLDALRRALPDAALVHIYASTELGALLTVRDGQEGFDAGLLDGERLRIVDGTLEARRATGAMLRYFDGAAPAEDEWVSTGDLVEVVDGRVRFRGRKNDVFNVGGSKVNPIEVEAVVRNVPGVLDVVVLAHRSSILGALPKAIVRASPGADRLALEHSIATHCARRLPPYMVPRLFEFRETLDPGTAQKAVRLEQ